jgi:hypothetical protein
MALKDARELHMEYMMLRAGKFDSAKALGTAPNFRFGTRYTSE